MTLMGSRHTCVVCPGHVLGTSRTFLLHVSNNVNCSVSPAGPILGTIHPSKWGHWLTQESLTSHLPTWLPMESSGKWVSNVLDGELNIKILSVTSNHGVFGNMDPLSNPDMISQWCFLPCSGKCPCSTNYTRYSDKKWAPHEFALRHLTFQMENR